MCVVIGVFCLGLAISLTMCQFGVISPLDVSISGYVEKDHTTTGVRQVQTGRRGGRPATGRRTVRQTGKQEDRQTRTYETAVE